MPISRVKPATSYATRCLLAALALIPSTSGASTLEGLETWSLESPGIGDFAEHLDNAGAALARADFNGDGFDDLAIGVPGDRSNGLIAGAGTVLIIPGSESGLDREEHFFLDQTFTPEGIEEGDRFGTTLETGDWNGDGHPDLAVGVPFEDVQQAANIVVPNAGEVDIFWGSESGLVNSAVSVLNQNLAWMPGPARINALFGFALAKGKANSDLFEELLIGAPFDQNVDGDAVGSACLVFGGSDGWDENRGPDRYYPSDVDPDPLVAPAFGWSVAMGNFTGGQTDELVVGVPGFDLGSGRLETFRINPEPGHPFYVKWQDHSRGENGDRFGFVVAPIDADVDGLDEIAVGMPGADAPIGDLLILDAGYAFVLDAETFIIEGRFFSHADIDEDAEVEDEFGSVLHVGDFNDDGRDDLMVGVPNEDLADGDLEVADAGLLHVFYGPFSMAHPRREVTISHLTDGLDQTDLTAGALFGFAMIDGRFDGRGVQVVVGVPGEDVQAYDRAGSTTVFSTPFFSDGFEDGDFSAWGAVFP